MMSLDTMWFCFREACRAAGGRAGFGGGMEIEGRKMIPVASVAYGFGYGGGQAPKVGDNGATGGGGGGGVRIAPPALVEVVDGKLKVQPIGNVTRGGTVG